jgi:hypothetical protein
MTSAVLAWLPVLLLWAAAACLAWIRFPVRRGALLTRWRDLRDPPDAGGPGTGIVDLSRRSAACCLALRVGALVRGGGYAVMFACVFLARSLPLQLLGLVAFVWIENRWLAAASGAFRLADREPFIGFDSRAFAYHFPRYRRGGLWNFRKQAAGMLLATSGFALTLAAGFPLAWESDTIPSPIPGLYVRHSGLPYWGLAAILLAIGATLLAIGIRADRSSRRRDMRQVTRVPERRPRQARMVFLRPFGSEELRVSSHPGPRRDGFRLLLPQHSEFLEDVATWLLWSRGEVVAVTRPGRQATRTLGAAHHPLKDPDRWQAAVSDLIGSATGIVLLPGVTPGVAWEYELVRSDPALAAKTLFLNSAPSGSEDSFLQILGASQRQTQELRNRQLLALGGVLAENGPKLLCSSLDEDVDFEMAVDWFLRRELPAAGESSRLDRLRSWAEGLFSPAQ